MINRRWANFNVPRQFERSLGGLGLGICIGIFLAICFTFESKQDVEQKFIAQQFNQPFSSNETLLTSQDLWIRCVILVQPGDPRPHKYIRSILDTYAKRCNKTLFFTKEDKLLPKFHDETDIYALNDFYDPTSYSFFHLITQLTYTHAQKTPIKPSTSEWTIFLNEQNFVVLQNLQFLLQEYDSNQSFMFGRLAHSKWVLTYLFPFLQTETFQLDAGFVMSRKALELVATSDSCQPHWFLPAYTGKSLYACGIKQDIKMIDPVDDEGYHLFMDDNLRNLFSLSHFSSNEKSFEDAVIKANCCSDKLISVGLVTHRDLRVMEYMINKMRVFGQ